MTSTSLARQLAAQCRATVRVLDHVNVGDHDPEHPLSCSACLIGLARDLAARSAVTAARRVELDELADNGPAASALCRGIVCQPPKRPTLGAHRRDRSDPAPSSRFGDWCERCADDDNDPDPTRFPRAVDRATGRATYHCDRCGHRWSCWWLLEDEDT